MNASLSDGNEPVIDIFILSANSPLSTQLEKQLRDEGYVVTLFSEGPQLLETLRNGKPNLLMCDTTSTDADAFEVCRLIKTDDFLWNIPVLIITGAADLGDLLRVLDSNADNFIAHPFDLPYLLSLIEGMLTVPVERPTPEQIKTQFKIKHDNQIFVVTADRRRLLEFLLSSFEIAVNKSTDLSRAQDTIQNLGIARNKLEDTVRENNRVIDIINKTLKSREQTLSELTSELADRDQTIREKIAAIDQISQDLKFEQSGHAETRSEFGVIIKQKDEALAASQSTIDQLRQQVSDLSSELVTLKQALERTKEDLLKESGRREDTENTLNTTLSEKDQMDKELIALTSEHEQLKADLNIEKNLARETEQELKAVLLAKTQSEQDLTQEINNLKNIAFEQDSAMTRLREESASEITRLKEDLESEQARLRQIEENLNTVTTEKERLEESLRSAIDTGEKDRANQQLRLDSAQSLIEEKKETIKTLSEEIVKVGSARDSLEQELASVLRVLEETKMALEAETRKNMVQKETLAGLVAEKGKVETLADSLAGSIKELQVQLEQEEGRYRDNDVRLNGIIQQRDRELGELRRAHEDAQTTISSQKTSLEQMDGIIQQRDRELGELQRAHEDAQTTISSQKASLEQMNGIIQQRDRELGELRRAHEDAQTTISSQKTSLEQMNGIIQQRDRELGELQRAHEDAQTTVFSHTTSLEQMNGIIQQRDRELGELRRAHEDAQTMLEQMQQNLNEGTSARTELAEKLRLAEEKIHRISQDLESTSDKRNEEKQQRQSLSDELDRVKTNLEKEVSRRQELEEDLRDALSQQQQLEQELERFVSETKSLHADLTAERRTREAVAQQIKSLEEQISALNQEKSRADQVVADLTAEIDQARIALAEEDENQVTADGRPAKVPEKKPLTASATPSAGVRTNEEIIKKRSLIVKGPTMPAEIRPLTGSLVTIDSVKAAEPETLRIYSVEDLFEDDDNEKEKPSGSPVVSIIQEPASEPVQDVLPDTIPLHSDRQADFFEIGVPPVPDSTTTVDEDKPDAADFAPEESGTGAASGQDIAFNRTQWLDLLKWSHHCEGLTQDQRMQIVRMGRLIQKGRKLTRRQEEQVLEMIALVQKLGYRIV